MGTDKIAAGDYNFVIRTIVQTAPKNTSAKHSHRRQISTCFGLISSSKFNSIHCWQRSLPNCASDGENDFKTICNYFLPDLNSWLQRLNSRLPSPRAVLFAKGVRGIEHDALVVKRRVSSVVVFRTLFVKVCLALRSHVVEEDWDEKISVRSGLLVNRTLTDFFQPFF